MPDDRRLAFVFSGGGAKGAFGVGVLHEIVRTYPALRWQIVSGTSTGGLIAPHASIGATDRTALRELKRFYLEARKADIVDSNIDFGVILEGLPMGLYNMRPLKDRIRTGLDAARRAQLLAGDVITLINAVNLQTGELALWTQRKNVAPIRAWFKAAESKGGVGAHFFPEHKLEEAMLASAAIPLAIEPQDLARSGANRPCPDLAKHQIVDGGVVDLAPLRAAIAAGATDIVAVFMSPRVPAPVCERQKDLLGVALRAVDLLTDEIGRNDVEAARQVTDLRGLAEALLAADAAALPADVRAWIDEGDHRGQLEDLSSKRPVRVEVVEPPLPLGDTLDFDSQVGPNWPRAAGGSPRRNVMKARFDHGVAAAAAAIAANAPLREMLGAFA